MRARSGRVGSSALTLVALVVALGVAGGAAAKGVSVNKTVRYVVGDKPYTVDELIRLESYQLNRAAFVSRIQWEQSQVDRARGLQKLAQADAAGVCADLASVGRALQRSADQAKRGDTSDFDELRGLQLELSKAVAELKAIEAAYPTASAVLTGERARADDVLRRVAALRFRVTRDGYVSELSLKDVESDQALSFETLFAMAAQADLGAVERNPEVKKAVEKFNGEAYSLLNGSLATFDATGNRGGFDGAPGKVAKLQAEEALFLMHFLRAKFRVPQALPALITDHRSTPGITCYMRDNGGVSSSLQELEKAKRNTDRWPRIPYLGGMTLEIRSWFIDRLLDQATAESVLRTKGGDAPELAQHRSAEATKRALTILKRRPSSQIVDTFRVTLLRIHAAMARTTAVKRNAKDVPSWDDMVESSEN